MPKFEDKDIKNKIANGNVFAITIDTCVFDSYECNFQHTVLKRLKQFKQRDVRFVLSEVIVREMKSHLYDKAAETQSKLRGWLKKQNKIWRREENKEEYAKLLCNSDPKEFAEVEFKVFEKEMGVEVLKISEITEIAEQVLNSYFLKSVPFGESEKRKHEFPDAFALYALEKLASDKNSLMLCVSADKSWVEIASKSNHLFCIEKLDVALSFFNDQDFANRITELCRNSACQDLIDDLENAIQCNLDDLDFLIFGNAGHLDFDADPISAELQVIDLQSIKDVSVIDSDAETVTFTIHLNALVMFGASFRFYIRDGIDRDNVNLGSEEAYIEKTLPFSLTITADRDVDDGFVFHDISAIKETLEIDFDYVEAFPNEDPTHEKY